MFERLMFRLFLRMQIMVWGSSQGFFGFLACIKRFVERTFIAFYLQLAICPRIIYTRLYTFPNNIEFLFSHTICFFTTDYTEIKSE